MPIIEISGVGRVEVGDEFLRLTPELQQQAVDEIAQSASVSKKPGSFWTDTVTGRVLSDVWSAMKLPGDVYAGRTQLPSKEGDVPGSIPAGAPGADETIRRATALGSLATPVSAATRAGVGFMGVPVSTTARELDIAAAGRLGVDLPRAAASNSTMVQRIGQALSNVPIGGSALRKASERATTQLGEAAETAAVSATGARVGVEQAGQTARAALERYIGPVTSERAQKLYDRVDNLVNPAVTAPLANTQRVAQEIAARRGNAAIVGESGALREVGEALARGRLNYHGIKDLRTAVGEKLNLGILPADISQAELKQVYGALSKDLEAAVRMSGGPRATEAYARANRYYHLVSGRRENLARLLGAKSDEALFDKIVQLAGSGASADARLLLQARKAVPAEEWADISAAAIARLGRTKSAGTSLPTVGAQPEEFSPALFLRDYGKLSQRGKAILFNSIKDGTVLRQALDDIARVSQRAKAWHRFGNPSGTAQNIIGTGQIAGFGAAGYAAFGGSYVEPLTAAAGVMGVGILSRVLASPVTASSLARWSRTYENFVMRPGLATAGAMANASRSLGSMLSEKFGISVQPADFMRAIQGPMRATPEQEEQ